MPGLNTNFLGKVSRLKFQALYVLSPEFKLFICGGLDLNLGAPLCPGHL